jgi:Cu(I)/Ag(I) efflux system protein CusF
MKIPLSIASLTASLSAQSRDLLSAALIVASPAYAADPLPAHEAASGAPIAAPEMTEGVVRKVDRSTQSVTLKHGDIMSLAMPGMTMAFKAQDPSMLKNLKPGDKVRFTADIKDRKLYLTHIEPAR